MAEKINLKEQVTILSGLKPGKKETENAFATRFLDWLYKNQAKVEGKISVELNSWVEAAVDAENKQKEAGQARNFEYLPIVYPVVKVEVVTTTDEPEEEEEETPTDEEPTIPEEEEEAPVETEVKEKKKPGRPPQKEKKEKAPKEKVERAPAVTARIVRLVCENPELKVSEIEELLNKEGGWKFSKATINVQKGHTLTVLKILHELGKMC